MKTLNFIVLLLMSIMCVAQSNSTYPQIPFTEFQSVDIIDDNILARGNCDQVWFSTDNGQTWDYEILSGQGNANVSLLKMDPTKAVLSLREETIIYDLIKKEVVNTSKNGTVSIQWAVNTFSQKENIYVLTNDGLFKSKYNEYDWEKVLEQPADSGAFNVGDITDDFIYIGTNDGKIYSHNLQDGSTSLKYEQEMAIRELSMGTNDIGYIVLSGVNEIQKTMDGGISFTPVPELSINRNVHAHGPDMVATILGFSLEVSTNGGTTVNSYRMSNTSEFGDIEDGYIDDNGTIIAYGKGSTIAKTKDLGNSFEFVSPYNRSDLYDAVVYDDGVGYAVGEFATILTTDDHGDTWSPVYLGDFGEANLNSIIRLENGQIVVAAEDAIHVIQNDVIIHTTEFTCRHLMATNQGSILASIYDQENKIIRSVDNGMTWDIVLEGIDYTSQIIQSGSNQLIIPSQSESLNVSNDDGVTWELKEFGQQFDKIYPFDDQIIMGSFGRDLFRSEDGGKSWTVVYNAYLIDNLVYVDSLTIYLTNGQNFNTYLMKSEDGGITWEEVYHNCTLAFDIALNAENNLIIAQATGHINKYETNDSPSATHEFSSDQKLLIWPNPISRNGTLQIDSRWDELQIIDLNGKVVSQYLEYQSTVDISNMESGIYFLQSTYKKKSNVVKLFVL